MHLLSSISQCDKFSLFHFLFGNLSSNTARARISLDDKEQWLRSIILSWNTLSRGIGISPSTSSKHCNKWRHLILSFSILCEMLEVPNSLLDICNSYIATKKMLETKLFSLSYPNIHFPSVVIMEIPKCIPKQI